MNNKEYFISRSSAKHNNKYNYDRVEYVNGTTKVKIICPIHGEFEQSPKNHLHKGCIKCGNMSKSEKLKYTKEQYVDICRKLYGDMYDYSLVEYTNIHSKIQIICYLHGVFTKEAKKHARGSACNECSKISRKINPNMTRETFIEQSNYIHNNKYNYDSTVFIDPNEKVEIMCYDHGIFIQNPVLHSNGYGCTKCGYIKRHTAQNKNTS
mgnify:CR=1 FL=1